MRQCISGFDVSVETMLDRVVKPLFSEIFVAKGGLLEKLSVLMRLHFMPTQKDATLMYT